MNRKIVEYITLRSKDGADIKVKEYIYLWRQPYGSPLIDQEDNILQVMVKYEDLDSNSI